MVNYCFNYRSVSVTGGTRCAVNAGFNPPVSSPSPDKWAHRSTVPVSRPPVGHPYDSLSTYVSINLREPTTSPSFLRAECRHRRGGELPLIPLSAPTNACRLIGMANSAIPNCSPATCPQARSVLLLPPLVKNQEVVLDPKSPLNFGVFAVHDWPIYDGPDFTSASIVSS